MSLLLRLEKTTTERGWNRWVTIHVPETLLPRLFRLRFQQTLLLRSRPLLKSSPSRCLSVIFPRQKTRQRTARPHRIFKLGSNLTPRLTELSLLPTGSFLNLGPFAIQAHIPGLLAVLSTTLEVMTCA